MTAVTSRGEVEGAKENGRGKRGCLSQNYVLSRRESDRVLERVRSFLRLDYPLTSELRSFVLELSQCPSATPFIADSLHVLWLSHHPGLLVSLIVSELSTIIGDRQTTPSVHLRHTLCSVQRRARPTTERQAAGRGGRMNFGIIAAATGVHSDESTFCVHASLLPNLQPVHQKTSEEQRFRRTVMLNPPHRSLGDFS